MRLCRVVGGCGGATRRLAQAGEANGELLKCANINQSKTVIWFHDNVIFVRLLILLWLYNLVAINYNNTTLNVRVV
jgi:hypothetical protein